MWQKIISNLAKWREERHLDIESQAKGLFGNVLEELSEFVRAYNIDDKDGMIDAICDVAVFTLNANNVDYNINSIMEREAKQHERYFAVSKITLHEMHIHFVQQTIQCFEPLMRHRDVTPCIGVLTQCQRMAMYIGYDFAKCMQETIKEISSRTGKWNDELGKFEKDTSDEAKQKWYKANYSKCKF